MNASVPVYCLTLAEEPWKEATVREHFEKRGVDGPVFVHGFHGMLIGLRPTNPFQFDKEGKPEYIHIAQAGAALSHLLMLKCALVSQAEEFICCEDDVELDERFTEAWPQLRERFPEWVDVVQLDYIPVQHSVEGVAVNAATTLIAPGLVISPGYAHCASMIWWRREAAEEAVRLLRPIDAPFDIMLMRKVYPFMNHALAEPRLATQRTAYGHWPSSIGTATYDHAHDPAPKLV